MHEYCFVFGFFHSRFYYIHLHGCMQLATLFECFIYPVYCGWEFGFFQFGAIMSEVPVIILVKVFW